MSDDRGRARLSLAAKNFLSSKAATRLERLNQLLEPHIEEVIESLIHQMRNSPREQVKERAASRILTMYADTSSLLERGEVANHGGTTLLVASVEDVRALREKAAAALKAKQAQALPADVIDVESES
jgi:hypothetical protein